MARSYPELMGLEFEAERLVRSGESRAEVSRRLGVSTSTLSQWALAGGWRKKDLDLERSGEATRATILAIRHGNARVDRQQQLRGELAGVMREAVALLAEGSAGSLEKLARMIGAVEAPPRLEAPKVVLGPDPKMGRMGSLGDNDVARAREPILTEDGEVWTPARERQINRERRAQMASRGRRKSGDGDR